LGNQKELRILVQRWRTEAEHNRTVYQGRFRDEEIDEKEARKHLDQWIGVTRAAKELEQLLNELSDETAAQSPDSLL